jgi:hypothetical protein
MLMPVQVASQVALAAIPPIAKQQTSPFEQFAELVHDSDAPPWH